MDKRTPACCCCGTSLAYRRAYKLESKQEGEGCQLILTRYYCLRCYAKAQGTKLIASDKLYKKGASMHPIKIEFE